MATAKDIRVLPISSKDAATVVKRNHYSGKVVNNSQLHLGVFLNGSCEGAMQFGPSLDKSKLQPLVSGTRWNGFIELNRMAFSDRLPKNSESRAIGYAMRLIKKKYPHIEWVVSFADGAQCGDGTIYRASGFVLTAIKKNNQIWEAPAGERFARLSLIDGRSKQQQQKAVRICRVSATKGGNILGTGGSSMASFVAAGFKPIPGFQLRYVYFLNPEARARLTVPELPFSKIAEMGAGMYRGEKRATSKDNVASGFQSEEGGVNPTVALQQKTESN